MSRPLWRNNYKSDWCVACTGDKGKSGVWAHWERKDGLTLCGEWHKPDDYPMSVTVDMVKAQWAKEKQEREEAHAKRKAVIHEPPSYTITLTITISEKQS